MYLTLIDCAKGKQYVLWTSDCRCFRGEMKFDTQYITTESVCLSKKSLQSIIDTKNVSFETTY